MEGRTMKQNLNEAIYNITSIYSASTSAGIIRDMICDMLDELQEHMRSNEDITWTEDIDEVMSDWIKENT